MNVMYWRRVVDGKAEKVCVSNLVGKGVVDSNKPKGYCTIDSHLDGYGDRNLKAKMNLQQDFMEEETLLQYHDHLLIVIIDRTPNCHPEMITWEGIKYSWVIAKPMYQKLLPMKEKK